MRRTCVVPNALPHSLALLPQQDCTTGVTQSTWNNEKFTAGDAANAMWFGPFNGRANNWTIYYPASAGLRVAKVLFVVDPDVDPPRFVAKGEYPYVKGEMVLLRERGGLSP